MINEHNLWKERFKLYVKDTRRYLRLIFNDHFKFVLLFAVGGGAFYYQNWLKTLPETFPSAIIIAFVVGVILTHSPIQTFLKEADLVFLLPLETKLKRYFYRSIGFSYIIQSYLLILVLAALGPLYFHDQNKSMADFLILLMILLVVKALNILIKWHVQYFPDSNSLRTDQLVRLLLNVGLVYVLVGTVYWVFPFSIGLLLILLFVYFSFITREKVLKWELLIELEAQRMMTFYRIANMFTDVPKLKEQVKRRKWLNWLTFKLSFDQRSAFSFLYFRTFSRSSDYLGVYIRLLLIGSVFLYYLPLGYSKLLILLLFIYLSGFQLIPLFRHHAMKIWIDLYPISDHLRRKNFLNMLFELLIVKSLLFVMIIFLTGDILLGFLAIGVSVVFVYVFTYTYVKNKLVK